MLRDRYCLQLFKGCRGPLRQLDDRTNEEKDKRRVKAAQSNSEAPHANRGP